MDLGNLLDYLKNQAEHFKKKAFEEEYRILLTKACITIDEKYFP